MKTKNKFIVAFIVTGIAASALFGTVMFVNSKKGPSHPPAGGKGAPQAKEVDFKKNNIVSALEYKFPVYVASSEEVSIPVSGRGLVEPHFDLSMLSEVNGRVIWLSDKFESGNLIKKGDVIAKVESISYEEALSEAKNELAEAKLDYLEEERQGVQSRLEWKRSGIKTKPASDLVLRDPQMKQVTLAVENAEKSVASALNDLENTKIKAPFDAVIVSRDIDLGSYLQEGSDIGEMNSVDQVNISVPLAKNKWNMIPNLSNERLLEEKMPVEITDTVSKQSWRGYVSRAERHIDETSRQRSIIVTVDDPISKNLYAGNFVSVKIAGNKIKNVLKLPEYAIASDDSIYYIKNNVLANKEDVKVIASDGGYVYVASWLDGEVQVVTNPISYYKSLVGKRAVTVETAGEE